MLKVTPYPQTSTTPVRYCLGIVKHFWNNVQVISYLPGHPMTWMWRSGGWDFNLGPNSWAIFNPIKVDVGDDSRPPDLNHTCQILSVYHTTLLEQWAGNSIPAWAPLDVNVTFGKLSFQSGPKFLSDTRSNQDWCWRWFHTPRPQLHRSLIVCVSYNTCKTVSR